MKTLFIVSKGIGKKPDEVIRQLEAEDKEPRSLLWKKNSILPYWMRDT